MLTGYDVKADVKGRRLFGIDDYKRLSAVTRFAFRKMGEFEMEVERCRRDAEKAEARAARLEAEAAAESERAARYRERWVDDDDLARGEACERRAAELRRQAAECLGLIPAIRSRGEQAEAPIARWSELIASLQRGVVPKLGKQGPDAELRREAPDIDALADRLARCG